ncbi:integral membrane protein [Aspergillus fumigatus]|nr:integral membrane protein [Aspergillus fumigatus]
MRDSKKLGTSMIFAAGIFACMCSIMRLVVSVQNRTVEDKTYDWFPEFLWTYSSRSAKRAIEVISWPTSWSVRQKKQSSGGHSMTELCQSTNCELDDIEQQPEEHTGRIFSGASYTTAGAQVGILELPNVASGSYTFESRGAGLGPNYRSGILKTVEVDVASQRG